MMKSCENNKSVFYLKFINKILIGIKGDSNYPQKNLIITSNQKKSQTTVIIILSILIFGSVILLAYLNKTEYKGFSEENKINIENAKTIVSFCIENSVSDSLRRVGFQGGYYEKPQYYYEYDGSFLTYYYYNGKPLLPSIDTIEEELEKAVNNELLKCRELEEDFKLNFGKPKTNVFIKDKEIEFNIDYPVSIEIDDKSTTILKKHYISAESGLKDIMEVAVFMTDSRKENPQFDCLSCLSKMAGEKNLYLDIYDFNEDVIIKIYENYTLNEQEFLFLNKFGD